MVKASELRIGNYLQRLDGSAFMVSAQDIVTISEWQGSRELLPKYIPLNIEWLKILGFIEQMGRQGVYSKGRLRIVVKEGLGVLAYLIDEDNERGYYIPNSCEFVHKVQNLYFTITGTELTIK